MGAPVLHATLLLLSAFLALTQTKNQSFAGSHFMQYLVTTTSSQPGLQDSHVCIVGHVDYMPFMRFDSDGAAQRIQTRGPWMKQMGPEYLEMERKNAEGYSHRARENLRFAIQVYNQSDKEPATWPVVGITVGVVLLGFVIIGALIAIVTMRKKRAGSHSVAQAGLELTM